MRASFYCMYFNIVRHHFIFIFNTKRPIQVFPWSFAKSLKVWVKCDYFEALHIEHMCTLRTWTLSVIKTDLPSMGFLLYGGATCLELCGDRGKLRASPIIPRHLASPTGCGGVPTKSRAESSSPCPNTARKPWPEQQKFNRFLLF